jgi:hypothetical protein
MEDVNNDDHNEYNEDEDDNKEQAIRSYYKKKHFGKLVRLLE